MEEDRKITLKVAEAFQDDVNKGIVRIDNSYMQKAGVRPGDIVEITGERKTVGIADRAYPSDIGQEIIRMDGLIRRNATTSIGELVVVRKADVKEAKKVIIAPARKGLVVRAAPEIFKHGLLGRAVVRGDVVSLGGSRRRRTTMSQSPFEEIFKMLDEEMTEFGFGDLKFIIADTNPKNAVLITPETEIVFNPEAVEVLEEKQFDISYEDIGGLSEEIKKVREMVELPLKHPEIFERLGIEPPKGVLLHGPPGTGKTLLAKAVANETQSHFIVINGPEIMSKYYGQSEQNIRKKFEEAEQNAPSIIFIDEIDAIASKREETHGEVEKRVVAQLLAIMDGLKSRGKVVVIAATNIPNHLDPALRRPGRFDREIEIGPPGKQGRLDILKIHTRNMPLRGTLYPEILEKEIKSTLESMKKSHSQGMQSKDSEISLKKKELSELKEKHNTLLASQKTGESEIAAQVEDQVKTIQKKIIELDSQIKSTENKPVISDAKEPSIQSALIEIENNKAGLRKLVQRIRDYYDFKETAIDKEVKLKSLETSLENDELVKKLSHILDKNTIEEIAENARNEGEKRDLELVAQITHGFVGADLSALTKEAAMIIIRRELSNFNIREEEPIPKEVLERLKVRYSDFIEALKTVRPSAMREVLIEVPNVKWENVAALDYARQELVEAVEWPLSRQQAFENLGITPPKGVLLYGPSGTGKTLLAKAVAHEAEANFISVKGPELLSKWVGESEKAVREIFKKARQSAPTIIFFDEFDAIAPKRGQGNDNNVTERVVNQLLTEIDGLEKMNDIVIIAASNRPDMIDSSLLRPGRFDRLIYVKVPDTRGRYEILKVHTKKVPIIFDDIDYELYDYSYSDEKVTVNESSSNKDKFMMILAKKTDGFSGADAESLVKEAAIFALRKSVEKNDNGKDTKVTMEDFEEALKKVKPSITKEIEEAYQQMESKLRMAKGEEAKLSYFG